MMSANRSWSPSAMVGASRFNRIKL
jgi:hypothetical protein